MAKETKAPEGAEDSKTTVEVPIQILTKMQEQMATMEKTIADGQAKQAGMEELLANQASTTDSPKLREKKTFEPKFRTVRLRKYPKAGGEPEYIVGWTSRGAYQQVDRTGVSPQIVDYIDVVFLGDEKTEDGKIKAQAVPLLDLLNKGEQVHCKVLDTRKEEQQKPTGEEISVTVFDPQHGLRETGDTIDGYVVSTQTQFKLAVPGNGEVWVDSEFCNK